MIFRVEELVRAVRVCLDEDAHGGVLAGEDDLDTLDLERMIRSRLLDGVRTVLVEAPVELLDGHDFSECSLFWGDQCSGYVLLPDDFLRLVSFRMSDWERSVSGALTAGDADYSKCRSRYKGIRGTVQRPVVAVVRRPEGLALEFYSCSSDSAYVATALYQPRVVVDADGGLDIPERLERAVVYRTAGLVLTGYGESDRGGVMINLSKSVMI